MAFLQKVTFVEEQNIVSVRPYLLKEKVVQVAKEVFGLNVDPNEEIKELVSYCDRNFLIKGKTITFCFSVQIS